MRRIVRKTWFVAALVLLTAGAVSYGEVIRVDNHGAADFATIQEAIDAAAEGDTVLVAPGIYTGDGNRDVDFKGKAITVRSEDGPRTCIIDSQGSESDPHRGFYFQNKEGSDSVLEGFTITGGEPGRIYGNGGGIYCFYSSPTIRDCIIVGNVARAGGGVSLRSSDAVISHCVIAGNCTRPVMGRWTYSSGGGLRYSRGHPTVRNCTIFGNKTKGDGGGVTCTDTGRVRFVNCILTGNESYGEEGSQLISGGCGTITGCPDVEIVNCCIEDDPNAIVVANWDAPRKVPDDCIRDDPLLAQPGYWDPNGTPEDSYDDFWIDGDYHLLSQAGRWDPNSASWVQDEVTSPCIDAGDPNSPIGYEPFPNGGIVNIGAYGGTNEASKSYFGQPLCETIIAGDINGDCRVDFADVIILLDHWLWSGERAEE